MTPTQSSGAPRPLFARTLLLTLSGSRVYGLHRAGSDVDVKGVALGPTPAYLGFGTTFEQADKAEEIEVFRDRLSAEEQEVARSTKLEGAVYEVRKFFRLAAEANPNLMDVLFCRDADVRLITPLGERLRAHRRAFLSARARHTYGGYALAQLKRIETHRRWLLHPPKREPTRAAFDLPENTVIPADQLLAARAAVEKKLSTWDVDLGALAEPERIALQGRYAEVLAEMQLNADERWMAAARAIGMDANFLLILDRERRYKAARAEWDHHREWQTNRNVDRAALEAQFGYDTKHGAHLVRLLRMAREILTTGEVHVWRGDRDAEELLAIRDGAWSYERLTSWAREEEAALNQLSEHPAAPLPRVPDREALDRLCVEIVAEGLGIS